jgi:hypothetical protein
VLELADRLSGSASIGEVLGAGVTLGTEVTHYSLFPIRAIMLPHGTTPPAPLRSR